MMSKISEIMEIIENKKLSGLEICLSITVAFLSGIIMGIVLSPKGDRCVGSYNGSHVENCNDETSCKCRCKCRCK